MESIHYSFFLTLSFYAVYYLGMQTILLKRGPVPRIGNNLCYGYPPLLVSFLALLHGIFLAVGFYGTFFGPFMGHWALLLSSLFLLISVWTFLWLRNFFCRLFLHKDGLLIVYLDGRILNLSFTDLKEISTRRLLLLGTLVYGIDLQNDAPLFLFHSTLMADQELLGFLKDKINKIERISMESELTPD